MNKELRILQIEDVPADAELEVRELKRAGLRVAYRLVETEEAFREALRAFHPDLIISDFSVPQFDGMFALALARELAPDVPFIFVSGTIGEEYAIRALKNGATDYVLKSNLVRLPAAVERALKECEVLAARRIADARHRATFDNAPIGIMHTDIDSDRILLVNPKLVELLGYPQDQLLGMKTDDILHPDHRGMDRGKYRERMLKGELNSFSSERQFVRKDGLAIWVHRTVSLVRDAGGKPHYFIRMVEDVTERKSQELKIARLSRIQAVLSGINSTIVRVRDRQELFAEACRIAVDHGNFGIAWIGLFDPAAQELTPVAWAGLDASEFLRGAKSTIRDDLPQGRGVLAQAIKTRKLVFDNDITINPEVGGKRRAEAIRRGYRSVIVLPLIVEGEVVGSLSLFAQEPNFFDDEELKLLTELAGDISFALEHIAKEEKLEKLSRIRAVSGEINASIIRIREREALLRDTCRIATEHGKFELVWVGLLDDEKNQVKPVAWTGFSPEAANAVTWESISSAKGTLGEAMQTRKPTVRNDIEHQYARGMLRQEALKAGCRSTVCLPLLVDNRVAALISLYATGLGFFDEVELALLGEVASNISFALESIARQEKFERLSRIRTVLGEMNSAIVRIRNKQQLFEEACRIAQEHGKFAMAWIGVLDEATQQISPVAKAGRDEGYLEEIKLTIDPNATRNLAIAVEAIGRGAPVVCNDIATDGRMRPWRAAALQRGYRSMGMLPLLLEQRAVGVFALYSPELGFFDEEEMKLLVELAGDIAFALQTIEKQEKLDYLSYYDPLTGLPNRTLFNDRLDQRIAAARDGKQIFAVIVLDIGRLRLVNDTFGRPAGDDLLRQISKRFKNVLQNVDLLANIGGDHFAIATRRAAESAVVVHLLEQALASLSGEAFKVNDSTLHVAAHAGVALYPSDGSEFDTLLRNAEAAVVAAKKSGQRYQFYAPQMNARVAEQLKLENDLRTAVEREQYVLHYQPRFDLASGQIVGMEALIRWQHPERGLVPPGEFIPLLEETGMILDVGRWALTRAASQHAAWCASGRLPPRIAVNVSLAQLQRRDFVDQMKGALEPVDKAAERIDLEITESMLMEDIMGTIDKLKAMQSLGLHIALDDFGTGYSSLSYLARLPINSLKIDRSFVMQMSKGPEQMAIVAAVISLARALNLKVVAEGVETEEQASLLRLLRCDEAQGYLFGRPVPPEALEEKLRQG